MKKPYVQKLRSKHNSEVYYTWSNWETKDIDGVEFYAVVRDEPSNLKLQQTFYIKKDNMELIK